jgi:adenine-specific DNA-methyltransferase
MLTKPDGRGKNRMKRQRVETVSPDLKTELIDQLRKVIPEAFAEAKFDIEKLKELIGGAAENGPERYNFTWAGKRDALAMLQVPTRATLSPDRKASVDFDAAEHVFIEGENLEVLKILYRSYFGRVKLIYIDPPYNTGSDLIYSDDFSDPLHHYLVATGQKTGNGDYTTSEVEKSGRLHSAWLSMMYPRLALSRQLLREDGFIFVSCDDNEFHNLRDLLNIVFGEENFISTIVIQSNKRGQTYKDIAKTHEYLLVYSRSAEARLFQLPKADGALPFEDDVGSFELWELRNRNPKFGRHNRPNLFFPIYVSTKHVDAKGCHKISLKKSADFRDEVLPRNSEGKDSCWRWSTAKILKTDISSDNPVLVAKKRRDGEWNIYEKSRKDTTAPKSMWDASDVINEQGTVELGKLGLAGMFDHPKPIGLIDKILRISTEDGDLILDFFAGSASTVDAVIRLNKEEDSKREVIVVQLPEPISPEHPAFKAGYKNLSQVAQERIRRAIKHSYPKANTKPGEVGFRSFRLTASNLRRWSGVAEKDAEAFATQLEAFADTLVEGWKPEDVIWEVALKEGYSLTSQINKLPQIATQTFWRVTDSDREQSFTICLDHQLKIDAIAKLGLHKTDIFICRDTALDDTLAANLALQCRLKVI